MEARFLIYCFSWCFVRSSSRANQNEHRRECTLIAGKKLCWEASVNGRPAWIHARQGGDIAQNALLITRACL